MYVTEKPTSRSVPVAPLVPVALAVVVGIAADRYAEPWGTPVWIGLASGLAVLAWVIARWRWIGTIALLGAWGALAGAWHHYRWSDLDTDDLTREVSETPRPAWVRGELDEVLGFRPGANEDDAGITRAVLKIREVQSGGSWRRASGRAMVTVVGDRSDLRAGTAVEAAGNLALVARPLNPGEFDYRAYLRAQGIRLRLSVDDATGIWDDASAATSFFETPLTRWLGVVRAWSQERLERGLDPEVGPLAAALLLGRREGVDPDVNDAFVRTGTTHLLAISGLQMQVLAVAFGWLFRLLGLSRRGTFAAVAIATVTYMMMVGLMPSVVRSAAMTVTGCLAGLVDRTNRPANTLSAAALLTLGLNPAHLFDVGCQLSFIAIAAIIWGSGPAVAWLESRRGDDPLTVLERRFEPGWRRWVRKPGAWLAEGLVVSTVVWLAALPLVALRFHLVSPIGVALNVPLVPMTSLALLASGVSLALSAVWEPLGYPAAWVNAALLAGTERCVRWGAARSWGYTFVPEPSWAWVLSFYVALGWATAAFVGRWRRRAWLAALLGGWVAVGLAVVAVPRITTRPNAPTQADVLAVGHGLAVVIDTGGGHAALYDCGRMRDPSVGRRVIAPALWSRGIRQLDMVVLSHADADHYNGLRDLLDRFPIAAVVVSEGFGRPEKNPGAAQLLDLVRSRGIAVQTVAAGESWTIGATRFDVRHPPLGWNPSAPDNARSIVLDVSSSGRHAWLTGDLEGAGLTELVAQPPPEPIDVLLAPHHGGRTANPDWLYTWASPAAMVVSQRAPVAGARDSLAALDTGNTPLLRTWKRGAVRLRWSREGIEARGFLDDQHDVERDKTSSHR
jgi:competence protein ComEC